MHMCLYWCEIYLNIALLVFMPKAMDAFVRLSGVRPSVRP